MCLSPIFRPNPYYRLAQHQPRYALGVSRNGAAFGKDTEHALIAVPCGHCADCVAAKQNALVQRVQVESIYNHLFFCTLTYDNKHLPSLAVQVPKRSTDEKENDPSLFDSCSCHLPDITAPVEVLEEYGVFDGFDDYSARAESLIESEGFDVPVDDISDREDELAPDASDEYEIVNFPYADWHHIQLLLKNLRDNLPLNGRSLKYLAVSELGKTNGRPHFHILFFIEKKKEDFNADGTVNRGAMYNLERTLWQNVFHYWSINVGTRKQPKYEPLFQYRKRFLGSKVYTNFDLHWVDPKLSPDGTSNVAYYVTKYLMKGSKKEEHRQQFLHLNLNSSQYHAVWSIIKCRMAISKGFGIDGRFETVEEIYKVYIGPSACDYAEYYNSLLQGDDLPSDDATNSDSFYLTKVRKKRVLIPNFDVCERIHQQLTRDAGSKPGPVFITPEGKHVPLAHYYQTKGYIYTAMDFYTIYYAYDDRNDTPAWEDHELCAKKEKKHAERLTLIERNSTFDTSPALLWGGDCDDNNRPSRFRF